MHPVELKKGVAWVGVVDWGIRTFHGHELSVHRGTSYNSYLVRDEKTALVDTVWGPFAEEWLEGLARIVDLETIDYVVVNHSEPDHSGALPSLMRRCPNATVVVSRKGRESVPGHYHQEWKFQEVRTGDRIRLGRNDLVFVEAPMLHWPDSMFTYLTGDRILMPNDAFGQHYAAAFPFNDQVDQEELYEEALKYYANILTPFSPLVLRKIDEVLKLDLPVDIIAPSHGVIWRKDPLQIVNKYVEWARQTPEPTAVVLYDTMWEGTRRMADAIGRGLASQGISHKLFHMAVADRNDVITEIFEARAVIIGSPTLNRGVMPTIAPILEDLKGLRFQNKIGAAFGSYGWSGESVKQIEELFERCKIPVVTPGVLAKWQPDPQALQACEDLGSAMARAIRACPA